MQISWGGGGYIILLILVLVAYAASSSEKEQLDLIGNTLTSTEITVDGP